MIIHSHEYDPGYFPAMPVIDIQVRRRAGETPFALTAIVDSGADATMISLDILREIGARKGRTGWLVGTTPGRHEVDLYTVAVQIGDHRSHYIEVVSTERPGEAIAGRDLLNHYMVSLNAPGNAVEVST